MLLLHGWPGSVREFYELIPKLIQAQDDVAYIVVAPSLPGYGFSEAAHVPGLNPTEMAIIFRNLMVSLGYNRFLVQGGDWGSLIGGSLATLFPENVIGYHSNMCSSMSLGSTIKGFLISLYPSFFIPEEYVHFVFPMSEKFSYLIEETGYLHIQATKPDTIGNYQSSNECTMHVCFYMILNLCIVRRGFGSQSSWTGCIYFGEILNMDRSKGP